MREMVNCKDNAKSLLAFQKYANYLRSREKYDEALVQTKRVLELAPEDPVGLWIAGSCYLSKGQYTTAEDYLNRGIKADKAGPGMYKTMAEVKNRLGRHDEAMAVLRQGLENTKGTYGYAEVLWDLVNAQISDGKFDEAEKGIKELQGLGYKPPMVEFLQARLAVTKGDWNVAKEILVDVLPKLQDEPGPETRVSVPRPMLPSTGRRRTTDRRLFGGREDRSLLHVRPGRDLPMIYS